MILVPVDFSPISILAMHYAVMLAGQLREPIKLFHAIPTHSVWLEEADQDITKEAEKELIQLADQVVDEGFPPSQLSTLIVHRFPLNAVIDDLVKTEGIKYIVMGTTGASGLKEHLLGSFTSGVIESSSVPVIAVPENARLEPFKRVVYASDLTHLEGESRILVNFIRNFKARLIILNIQPTDSLKRKDARELEQKLRLECDYSDLHVHFQPGDDLEEAINAFLLAEKADLLAMFTRKKHFFKDLFCQSHTEEMACHIPVPLFAFKPY